jgi:NADH:ubiquinone oxidoreductase subunit E
MNKKKKVEVKICVGTACFVQGGADLLLYNDFLDPEVLSGCEIEGSSCLDSCKNAKAEVADVHQRKDLWQCEPGSFLQAPRGGCECLN